MLSASSVSGVTLAVEIFHVLNFEFENSSLKDLECTSLTIKPDTVMWGFKLRD